MLRFGCMLALGTAITAWGLGSAMIRRLETSPRDPLALIHAETSRLNERSSLVREKIRDKSWLVLDWCHGDLDTGSLVEGWISINQGEPAYPGAISSHYPNMDEREVAIIQVAGWLEGMKPLMDSRVWQDHLEELAAHTAGP